jgi:hypothetical protein
MLLQLDANHDGQIDASEVQGPRGRFAARLLERVGIQPNFPISVNQIRAGLLDYYHLTSDQALPSASALPARPATSASGAAAMTAAGTATASLVPGFGVSDQLPIPPGFGVPAVAPAAASIPVRSIEYSRPVAAASSFSSSSASSTTATAATAGPPLDEKIRQYAQSLVQKYDTNKNGVLERDEWKNMSGDWQAAAANSDGILTVDAIATYLMSRSKRSGSASAGSAAAGGTPSTWKSYSAGATSGRAGAAELLHKGVRFLTPAERLPKGLPAWFIAKDTNGDGQISMSEFSQSWTEATAKEFMSYDLNGDGVITAEEVLAKIASDAAGGNPGSRPAVGISTRPAASGSASLSVTGTNRPAGRYRRRSDSRTE